MKKSGLVRKRRAVSRSESIDYGRMFLVGIGGWLLSRRCLDRAVRRVQKGRRNKRAGRAVEETEEKLPNMRFDGVEEVWKTRRF